jgi:hypothetical protein
MLPAWTGNFKRLGPSRGPDRARSARSGAVFFPGNRLRTIIIGVVSDRRNTGMPRVRRALLFLFALHAVAGCGSDGGANSNPATDAGGIGSGTGGISVGSGGQGVSSGGATGSAGSATGSGGRAQGSGGAIGPGGTTGGGGTSGSTASGGASPGGATGRGGASTGGVGGLPPGAVCANDSNCGQSQGPAVCCAIPGCTGPCECRLASGCPKTSPFLECNSAADCAVYGGGKICCRASSGGQTMQYCTKQNGCPGTTLP